MGALTRPVLRYHGGKWRLAPWVIQYFPRHRIYVEPFGGAASMLMRKVRSFAEVYNDLDSEVVNVFRVLRDPITAMELHRVLSLTPFAREEFEESYSDSDDNVEQARKTIIKAFMGFGNDSIGRSRWGGMRTKATTYPTGFRGDAKRRGATPAGDWATYPRQIEAFTERLSGVVIECRDALEIIKTHDSDQTLHYIDPPYQTITRSRSKSYKHEMKDEDHARLAGVLREVQGMVVISSYQSDLYEELYKGWKRVERDHLSDAGKKTLEVLWMNDATVSGLTQIHMNFEAANV